MSKIIYSHDTLSAMFKEVGEVITIVSGRYIEKTKGLFRIKYS